MDTGEKIWEAVTLCNRSLEPRLDPPEAPECFRDCPRYDNEYAVCICPEIEDDMADVAAEMRADARLWV